MQVAKNRVVLIDYHLTDPQGKVLDSSRGREPLAYLHGGGNIIPGLEEALTGRVKGEALTITVAPAKAYGEKDPSMIQAVSRDAFKGIDKIEAGMQFQTQGPGGQARVVTVTQVDANEVTVDANHPLAGVPLTFDVVIQDVRDASDEEIQHGHVHGAGGHHH